MGLKRVMWVRRYQGSVGRYDPWGIKATGFAVTTKINHYAAVRGYGQMLCDMTMQTPPLSAFAKAFAIFFFSISNLVAP